MWHFALCDSVISGMLCIQYMHPYIIYTCIVYMTGRYRNGRKKIIHIIQYIFYLLHSAIQLKFKYFVYLLCRRVSIVTEVRVMWNIFLRFALCAR